MSNLNYHDDIKIIKKPLKKRLVSISKILIIGVLVSLCFLIASYLSSAITVGNLGAYIVYGSTNIKIKESSLYAVSLGVFDSIEQAEKVALGTNIQGAGGYIWIDDKFSVIGNVYHSYVDAEKVVGNLKDSNYNISIKEIKYPSINLDFDMYENSDIKVISDALNIFDNLYIEMYNHSIKFDKGDITHLAISSRLSESRGKIKSLIVELQNLLNKSSSSLKKVQSSLIKLDEMLDETIIKAIDNSSTNYSLKYATTYVARIKYDLWQELK